LAFVHMDVCDGRKVRPQWHWSNVRDDRQLMNRSQIIHDAVQTERNRHGKDSTCDWWMATTIERIWTTWNRQHERLWMKVSRRWWSPPASTSTSISTSTSTSAITIEPGGTRVDSSTNN
jgi:hypothetical protein